MTWQFIQAAGYYPGRKRNGDATKARLLVIHDMEVRDSALTAENVARVFARDARASAHFTVDQDSIVQCVSVNDTAWAAPHANSDGIHFELAGYARHTRARWLECEPVLNMAALAVAEVVDRMRVLGVPVKVARLTPTQISQPGGPAGLCGHVDVTAAYHTGGGHTDPGPNFPWDMFLPKVQWWLGHGAKGRVDFR